MSEVANYLKTIADMVVDTPLVRNDWKYSSYEALVLDQGRLWGPEVEVRVSGPIKECFTNAWHDANNHGWLYIEGYADSGIIPVQHAWCVDENGTVIETTWEKAGQEYLGVALDTDWVAKVSVETGYWGILGNDWIRDVTLLKRGFPPEAKVTT